MEAKTVLQSRWKETLEAHQQHISFALTADKLNYDYIRSAVAVQEASSPSLSLSEAGALDNAGGKLNEINIDARHCQEQVFEKFRQKIESLKDLKPTEEPSESAWKTDLVKKREELKKKSDAGIDQSFDAATAYIEQLP